MRLALAIVLLLTAASPVEAGELFRCEAADGSLTYTNAATRPAGQRCRVIQRYAPASTTSAAVAGAPTSDPPAARKMVDFRSAPGAQAPTAPAAASTARVTRGAVYKYERDGVAHYTNVRPHQGERAEVLFTYVEACYACAVRPGVDFRAITLNTSAYAAEVRAAASEFAVDEALVRAVIHAESAFNPHAISNKGAQGLMQLIPATAERFGVGDPFDATQNIRGGVSYLAWLLKRFDGNVTLATAAYNAGEGAVDRHRGVPPYAETQRYVERVGILADRYRGQLAGLN
jgi:soluble lytic murein transglycosylase-like protein